MRAQPGDVGRVPAIALTAYATTSDRVRIFSAGFQAHLVKPVDPAELTAVVAAHRPHAPRLRPIGVEELSRP